MRDFLYRHRTGVAITAVSSAGLILAGAVAAGSFQGPMMVDHDAVEHYNATVDHTVVDFYDSVCKQVATISELPQQFGAADERSVGQDNPHRAQTYRAAYTEVKNTVDTTITDLTEIDNTAPTKINRVDGAAEGTNYSGAVQPLITYLTQARTTLTDNPDLDSDNTEIQTEAISALRTTVADIPRGVGEPLQESLHGAAIFADATENAVLNSPHCATVINPDNHVADDLVVHSIVDFLQRNQKASQAWSDGNSDLSNYANSGDKSYTDTIDQLAAAWEAVSTGADTAAQQFDGFTLTDTDTQARAAASELPTYATQLQDSYRDLHRWADNASQQIRNYQRNNPTEADSAALSTLIQQLSDEFTDKAHAHQRLSARINNEVSMPNTATSRAAQAALEE